MRRIAILAVVAFVAALTSNVAGAQGDGPLQPDSDRVVYAIAPHDTDAAIDRFNDDNLVIYRRSTAANAPLLVFMPGTGGTPASARLFMDLASKLGYRVIGLMYDDTPAVNVVCPTVPDPKCTESFRQKRIYGDNVTNIIDDTPAESIVARLTKLLAYLGAHYPNDGWGGYLADGKPNWARIAVSGHSQGAGMAAFIAKDNDVYRVVLFSSPWDSYNQGRQLASWLLKPPATPLDRWFAVYHAREPAAKLMSRTYPALSIPASQRQVLDLEPRPTAADAAAGAMAYHWSVIGDGSTPLDANGIPAYLPVWKFLLGNPGGKN
jgi:acetyl esterase/lipase